MKKLQKIILSLLTIFCLSGYTLAQTPQTFFQSFTGMSEEAISVWTAGNSSTRVIENGHYVCFMANQGSAYRGDIKYNNVGNTIIDPEYTLTLKPANDAYLAIKFIGKRPANSATYTKGFKLEMKYKTVDGEAWLNTQWNYSEDGLYVTDNGNHIYYFDLTKDETYQSMAEVEILFFNIVIADVDAAPYEYTIDWIGTFASVEDIAAYKTYPDDGENDKDEEEAPIVIPEGPQAFFESFTGMSDEAQAIWVAGNNSTRTIENGHYIGYMADQETAYRGDIKYNNISNVIIDESCSLTLKPANDAYLAIKFIGKRPENSETYTKGFKLEMKYINESGTDGWLNTKWNNGETGFTVTEKGNYIYYFRLSEDETYASMNEVKILFFNLIIADVDAEPYEYTIDWIGTFASVGEIEKYKAYADDGEDDEDETIPVDPIDPNIPVGLLESFTGTANSEIWGLGNDATGAIRNGHFVCDAMTEQVNGKYRADLKYNNTNNNPISEEGYFALDPETHHYLAVKFIGERPDGALKMEMKTREDNWFNNAWNGGNPPSVSTDAGNYVYYFDLTTDASYVAGGKVVIKLFNLIIADAEVAPYSYAVDWVGVFESLEAIEEFKNAKDDGDDDKDEEKGTDSISLDNGSSLSVIPVSEGIEVSGVEVGDLITLYNMQGANLGNYVAGSNKVSLSVTAEKLVLVRIISQGEVATFKVAR